MTDFRKLRRGDFVPLKGLQLIITDISTRRGGWVRVLATLDGLDVKLHKNCHCDRPDGEIPVLDMVTESEYLCCASCRAQVND